jgi:hypothetical protein
MNRYKLIQWIICSSLLLSFFSAFAVKRYWVGNGSNTDWNTTANWSSSSGGSSGASVPISTDSVYFNSGGLGQCSFDMNISVRRIEVSSSYTDTLKQNTFTFTVGPGGVSMSGGVFKGGSGNISFTSAFSLTGTTFISTSGTLSLTSHYTFSSGSFSHNNGTVSLLATSTITGSTTFYKLFFTSGAYTITSGTVLTVLNELKTTGTSTLSLNVGDIHAKGDITIENSSLSTTSGGSGTITINGTAAQIFIGGTTDLAGRLCNIVINKPSGTLSLKQRINVMEDWSYLAGTIDASTDTSTVVFVGNNGDRRITGTHALYNVSLYGVSGGTTTNTVKAGDTLSVLGTLATFSTSPVIIDSGVVAVKGNLTINATYTGNGTGGDGTILFNGTGTQTVTGGAGLDEGRVCNVKISKPSGTLFLKNIFPVQGDWIYVQGTIDASTYSSTVQFTANRVNSVARNLAGKHSLHNVSFGGTNHSPYTINAGDTITVNGELSIIGSGSATIDNGVINAKGDIANTNSGAATGGTGTINICGTSGQILSGGISTLQSRFCNIKINKPSGTLTLKQILVASKNWTYLQGTIDASTFNSTVVFNSNTARTITGKHSLYNVTFSTLTFANANTTTITSGDTLTVLGHLRITGAGVVNLNAGTITALGDISMGNTGTTTGGGSAWIYICGTGNQTLTGSGVSLNGLFCNIKIDKVSGTLYLAETISNAVSTWQYIKGTVDPGTSSNTFIGGATIDCQGTSATMSFNNFRIQGGSSAALLGGALIAKGNFVIDLSRSINTNSYPVTVGGNWDVIGTYTGGTTKVTFDGSINQYILHPTTTASFYDVEFNKSAGKFYTNMAILSVSHALTMKKGIVACSSSKYVTMPDNATCTAGSDSSYVCGPFRKTGNDAFVFPLGDTLISNGAYHPLSIPAPSSTSDVFSANYVFGNPVSTYGAGLHDTLGTVSNCEYWTLERVAGSTNNLAVTISWNKNSMERNLFSNYRVASWSSGTSKWLDLQQQGIVGDTASGTLQAVTGVNFTSSVIPITISRKLIPITATFSITDATRSSLSGGSITVTPIGGRPSYTYSWAHGGTAATSTGLAKNTYTVTITDAVSQTLVLPITVGNQPEWVFDTLSAVSLDADGKSLIKTGSGDDWCDGNAITNNRSLSTDTSWIEFKLKATTGTYMLGMSTKTDTTFDAPSTYRTLIDKGVLYVLTIDRDGYFVKEYISLCTPGQKVKIELTGQSINYYLDGRSVYSVTQFPEAEYYLDADINTNNSGIGEIRTSFDYN